MSSFSRSVFYLHLFLQRLVLLKNGNENYIEETYRGHLFSNYSKKLVADQLSIKDTSIEDLIKELRMNNDQIYELKNHLLNKYINI